MSKWDQVCRGNELGDDVVWIGTSGDRGRRLSSRSVSRDFSDDECQQFITKGNCTSAGEGGFNGET